ncbi:hypothetical protein Tco_1577121 [Tanacetum coccineum]
MATLRFVDTHNMIAFLSKPIECEGFEQIVDFLNAHPIRYALTANPTIYVSCIEQFSSSAKAKTVNEEIQLHAKVDGKEIIITESSVRRDLQLADEEGVDCLPNSAIFENLALMGYEKFFEKLTFYKAFFSHQWKFLIHTLLQCLSPKTNAWNEFSRVMASAIICLATNQKFNFSKYIFESMLRNLDNLPIKFNVSKVSQPSSSTLNVVDEAVTKEMDDRLVRAATTASSLEAEQDSGNINKTQSKATSNESSSYGADSDVCTNLQQRVLVLEDEMKKTKTAHALEIASLNRKIKRLEKQNRSRTHKLKRLYKVGLTRRIESAGSDLNEHALIQGRKFDSDLNMFNDDLNTDDENFDENVDDAVKVHDDVNVDDVVEDVVMDTHDKENVVEEVVEVINTSKVLVDTAKVSTAEVKVKSASEKVSTANDKLSTTDIHVSAASVTTIINTTAPTTTTTTALITVTLKQKGITIQESSISTTTISTSSSQQSQSKDKDEEKARRLQAQFDEKDRVAREKAGKEEEENLAFIQAEWENVQVKVERDYEYVEQLQTEERENLTEEERSQLWVEFFQKRKKTLAA